MNLTLLLAVVLTAPADEPSVDFQRQVQPILAKRCTACHGPAEAESGLNLNDKETVFAELDSSNLRARVKARVKVKLLLDETIQERELILYFDRDSVDDPWYMKLEDSLRELSPDSTKQN